MQYPPVTQFPDLTEILFMAESWKVATPTEEDMKKIKTEFIFYVAALKLSPSAVELGFKPVSCMNNWFSAHRRQQRRMTLYWMRNPHSDEEPQPAYRIAWGGGYYAEGKLPPKPYIVDRTKGLSEYSFLAASGCGFNIGEPPFDKGTCYQFPTLMRMPVEVLRPEAQELVKHGYRLLDTGKLASYWVNGWKPEKYDFVKECKYFNVNLDWSPKEKKVIKTIKDKLNGNH